MIVIIANNYFSKLDKFFSLINNALDKYFFSVKNKVYLTALPLHKIKNITYGKSLSYFFISFIKCMARIKSYHFIKYLIIFIYRITTTLHYINKLNDKNTIIDIDFVHINGLSLRDNKDSYVYYLQQIVL